MNEKSLKKALDDMEEDHKKHENSTLNTKQDLDLGNMSVKTKTLFCHCGPIWEGKGDM